MVTLYTFLKSLVEKLNKAIKTDKMDLTEDQKAQARKNIGALGSDYTPPIPTAEQVGADPKGTAGNLVSAHNTGKDVHNDIRLLISALSDRINAIANSEDTDLDDFKEVVAYIKNNKSLIDGIASSKVNVADIIDNLATNVTNKPLSASQGVVLKGLIDAITIPTKVSQLENDKGYLTQHQDLSTYALKAEIPDVSGYQTEAQVIDLINATIPASGDEVSY